MIFTLEKVQIQIKEQTRYVKAEIHTRDGSKSPNSWYFWIDGKRWSPTDQKYRGLKIGYTGLFQMLYQRHIKTLLASDFKLISYV